MEGNTKNATLKNPWRGYRAIEVDLDSYNGGYNGCRYRCVISGSGAEIWCYEDEFDWDE